ncbi:MAG: non-canonical purine NTP pyrophosphatase [Treponema sp.]|nr:non-canonical purine NTP pyrophosphatase [Treponema sp.]
MKIYLATGNKNKKREMAQILENHTIVIPSDEGICFNPVENGTTFYENSLIKARALYELVHCPVIADDSGICVSALGGAPGIYSARYAGPSFPQGKPDGSKIPQSEQNKFLVEQLNDALTKGTDSSAFPNGPRSAHYTCAMVLYLGGDRLYVAEETMEGTIVPSLEDAAGTGGFGYDPLFFLPQYGKTAAQLSADEKNAVSHRGKATRAILQIIKDTQI